MKIPSNAIPRKFATNDPISKNFKIVYIPRYDLWDDDQSPIKVLLRKQKTVARIKRSKNLILNRQKIAKIRNPNHVNRKPKYYKRHNRNFSHKSGLKKINAEDLISKQANFKRYMKQHKQNKQNYVVRGAPYIQWHGYMAYYRGCATKIGGKGRTRRGATGDV